MGMEIFIFRFSKGDREKLESGLGRKMADWLGSDWDLIDPNLVWYGCGYDSIGTRIFREYSDQIDSQAGTISKESAEKILELCRGIVSKYRIACESVLQFPVDYLKKLVAEAESAGEEIVTVPFEDMSEDDSLIDDSDVAAARSLAEALGPVLENWTDSTELFIMLSY